MSYYERRELPMMLDAARQATEDSWSIEYCGNAANRLYKVITKADYDVPYANTMAIVQSSGMGKSRAVDELAKLIFTLPFNIRDPVETKGLAYPHPDKTIRDFFMSTVKRKPRKHVAGQFLVFFAALFDVVAEELKEMLRGNDAQTLCERWRGYLGGANEPRTVRDALYKKATEHAQGVLRDLEYSSWSSQLSSPSSATASECLLLKSKEGIKWDATPKEFLDAATLKAEKAAENLTVLIAEELQQSGVDTPPLLVMYFDEAHDMFKKDTTDEYTYYDALLNALACLHRQKVFALFLSTNTCLALCAPIPWPMTFSQAQWNALHAPFTELSFDCHRMFPLEEHKFTMDDTVRIEFMSRFGRPLFWTRYEAGRAAIGSGVIDFAKCKLIGASNVAELGNPLYSHEYLSERSLAELAVLDVRVSLDFDRHCELSNVAQQRLIRGNMRIAFSVPAHREYIYSGYPSEPILAHGAKQAMKGFKWEEYGERDDKIARILRKHVDSSLITKGVRGELVARLLLTLAMDKAEEIYVNRRAVPLLSFLEALVGTENWEEIRRDVAFEKAFEFAWVNFSHFGRAGEDTDSDAAYAALLRGMAIRCWTNQPVIDIVIPVFMDNEKRTGKICAENTTAVLVSLKPHTGGIIDEALIDFFPEGSASYAKRPYVTIFMDLEARSATVSAGPKESADTISVDNPTMQEPITADNDLAHPCYSLFIRGCSNTVYGVIVNKDVYAGLLESRDLFEDHERKNRVFTDAIKALKPEWSSGTACYSWADIPELHDTVEHMPEDIIMTGQDDEGEDIIITGQYDEGEDSDGEDSEAEDSEAEYSEAEYSETDDDEAEGN